MRSVSLDQCSAEASPAEMGPLWPRRDSREQPEAKNADSREVTRPFRAPACEKPAATRGRERRPGRRALIHQLVAGPRCRGRRRSIPLPASGFGATFPQGRSRRPLPPRRRNTSRRTSVASHALRVTTLPGDAVPLSKVLKYSVASQITKE